MEYEIIQLEEKTVKGLKIITSNSDPDMSRKIGMLWQQFFEQGIYHAIPNKITDKSIGLYTNYKNGVNGSYDVMVCCEVKDKATSGLPEDILTGSIPAGRYAKFIIHGHMQIAVGEFWMKLWSMDLDRSYSCDFEEYQCGDDMENAEIHIYISIK